MCKISQYGVFSGPYFPILSPNMGKCGPKITPYLDIFHTVKHSEQALYFFFVEVTTGDLLKLIKRLNINKALRED